MFDFLKEQSDADIFCFQEVMKSEAKYVSADGFHSDIYSDLEKILPEHHGFFASMRKGIAGFEPLEFADFDADLGTAIFVKKNLKFENHGMDIVHQGNINGRDLRIDCPRGLQHVTLGNTTIFNFHGISTWPKTEDSEARIIQSKNIRSVIDEFKCRKIVCGDFNLAPETKSMDIIEKGMNNLIKPYGIKSTRSSIFKKEYKFSDYVLTTPDIKVNSFKVPDVVVSDHLPLILEFE
ncbi:MAG: endonuclease/exonuclease/phosphatase family protein [Candidatus Aenigmarchaeota archaeon]|nr:endonuclease/exonuclease/phosphatase family protein [Candidatus Aenigmarchaeota archaeon]